MDSINWTSYYLNKCQTLSNTSQMTFFFQEDSAFGAHALCMQHSPNAAAPSTVFLLNYAPPPAARAERIDYKGHTAA